MAQDPREISQLVKKLEAAKSSRRGGGGGKNAFSCKKNTYAVAGTNGISVNSWKFNDWDYYKHDLPTYARGLFTTNRLDGTPEIVIRGYDKFFNINEVKTTEWPIIEQSTVGPYELSVKENGCIIFMSGLEDGTLLVCSKHSTGAREDAEKSHAISGERWIERHLASAGRTKHDLARTLRQMNVTAVAELCDDAFEEHVLAYPPDMAGLYIHGINFNLPEFATLSGPEVHRFADTWGFKKAQYIMMQTIQETKMFLDKCAETGSWDGRDTEGFVVRCKIAGSGSQPGRDWFFKYKFDEPYLMYRQWRECTKAVIAGKPPKIRKHKKITEEYLLYARRQMAKDPKLGKLYNQNHGIIQMRDGFLHEKGLRGSDIIANEEEEERGKNAEPARNIVLVPIATIGCGKTTVATALVRLFGFGHVQNDNIQGSKNRANRFALQITNAMADRAAVIADRNNHQFRERQQIIDDILKIIPEATFVALHYVHHPKERMVPEIRKITTRRVLDRGDNHQTIHATSKGEAEILGIMDGFLNRFQPLDASRDPDASFDQIINLDVAASPEEQLETVVTHLYNAYPSLFSDEMPTHQDMVDAVAFAQGERVMFQHDLSFGKKETQKLKHDNSAKIKDTPPPSDLTPEQLVKRLEYFGATVSSTNVNSILSSVFATASAQEADFYKHLKQSDRVQKDFHVTLIHRASAQSYSAVWQEYTSILLQKIAQPGKKGDIAAPSLGPARIRLERVIWDDRLMCILVRILPSDNGFGWQCANAYPHITVGTAKPEIKPKESNDLLARWMESSENGEPGNGGKIWELEIPGMKVLEAAVRPVMQRGR